MLSTRNIYKKPLVEKRGDIHRPPFPSNFMQTESPWLWSSIKQEQIKEIVAMRFYPHLDCVVIKLKYKDKKDYTSIYVYNIWLKVLRAIWECGKEEINLGIRYYLLHSESGRKQYRTQRTLQDIDDLLWYKRVTE